MCIRSHAATDITGQVLYPKEPQIEKFSPYTEHAKCAGLVPTSVCPPPLEKEAVSPMHIGYPHYRNGGWQQVNRGQWSGPLGRIFFFDMHINFKQG